MAGIADEVELLRRSLALADESRGAAGVGFDELHEACGGWRSCSSQLAVAR